MLFGSECSIWTKDWQHMLTPFHALWLHKVDICTALASPILEKQRPLCRPLQRPWHTYMP
jgi:hypothetical protein